MGDKQLPFLEQFLSRINGLNIDLKDIKRAEVSGQNIYLELPNKPGKQNSLKLYAYLAQKNNNKIGAAQAKSGLNVYGKELCDDAKKNKGKHPAIDLLEDIVSGKKEYLKVRLIQNADSVSKKTLPFSKTDVDKIIKKYPTPFHIYHESGIRQTARNLYKAFSWIDGFKNYFAVKANPNPHLLKILKEEGMGADCSSLPELILSEKTGLKGEEIMFTSNDTPYEEFKKAKELGAIINLDDISHIPVLEKHVGIPDLICFRYNPGALRKTNVNNIIGKPEDAKYGLTKKQLFEAYKIMRDKGVKRFGLHTMVVSNELNNEAFIETAQMLFDLVVEISKKLQIRFEFVNLGGGIGIPYKPGQTEVNLDYISKGIQELYKEKIVKNNLAPLRIVMECGRFITGPHGFLVTTAIHKKQTYKNYVGLDACMANLMRPALYGAYHHITVMGKEKKPRNYTYDVVGSLCENNDKFAVNRKLPKIETGDIIIIHDTGAHGYSMGFNYNGKLRSKELLIKPDKKVELIRRAETIDDYFATLTFPG